MKIFRQNETYISEKIKFSGDIEADTDISIDGRVEGNLWAKKRVTLGSSAYYEGNIECESALICGRFIGTLVAKRLIEIKVPATIIGDLIADSVKVDSGVAIQGKICAKTIQNDSYKPVQMIPEEEAAEQTQAAAES